MSEIRYTTFSLPRTLIDELKALRKGLCARCGRDVSYAEIVRVMLCLFRDAGPDALGFQDTGKG